MSEMKSVLEVIRSITSNRESGRLEINTNGTYGTLLFHEGKLVDARLGSLSGFQAVNAAVALRDVQFSFDHVEPALQVSAITPSERVVLQRFFGIEAAEVEAAQDEVEPDNVWNEAPEPVVPLVESETLPGALFWKPRIAVAVFLALVIGLAAGTIAMRSAIKSRQQAASVASAVETNSRVVEPDAGRVAESQPGGMHVGGESSSTTVSQQPVTESEKPRTGAEKPITLSEKPAVASDQPNTLPRNDSSAAGVIAARRDSRKNSASNERAAEVDSKVKVQDLTGEWHVINTVEKTGYKSFNNLEVGFRLTVNQNGKEFSAKGEKFSENGQTLPADRRTPITVNGTIEGDKVVATFIEDGRMRRTNGRFVWKLQDGGNGLAGTFVSTAANSRGRSAVTKY